MFCVKPKEVYPIKLNFYETSVSIALKYIINNAILSTLDYVMEKRNTNLLLKILIPAMEFDWCNDTYNHRHLTVFIPESVTP